MNGTFAARPPEQHCQLTSKFSSSENFLTFSLNENIFFPSEIQPWPDKQPQQKLFFPLLWRVLTARLSERWSKINRLCCIGFSRTLFFHHDHSECHKSGILVKKNTSIPSDFSQKSSFHFQIHSDHPRPVALVRSGFLTATFGVETLAASQCKYHSGFASLLFQLAKKSPLDIDNSLGMSGIKILEELEQNLCNLSSSKVTVWYSQRPPAGRISQS